MSNADQLGQALGLLEDHLKVFEGRLRDARASSIADLRFLEFLEQHVRTLRGESSRLRVLMLGTVQP